MAKIDLGSEVYTLNGQHYGPNEVDVEDAETAKQLREAVKRTTGVDAEAEAASTAEAAAAVHPVDQPARPVRRTGGGE